MTESGTYLYAIAGSDAPVVPAVAGVGDQEVRRLDSPQGLTAYVSTVPLADFGEAALRRNLEDLQWLEETARAHHTVVETISRAAAVAPVRLVTVYDGDQAVEAMLDERAGEFSRILAGVAGCSEWAVKIYQNPEAEPAEAVAASNAGASPGVAYLKRRQAGLRAREEAMRRTAELAEGVNAELSELAVARRLHRPQDPQLSGERRPMVLNAAYLVHDGDADAFREIAVAPRDEAIEVQTSGPWAPYSFAVLDEGRSIADG